jgi:hypothetical protein
LSIFSGVGWLWIKTTNSVCRVSPQLRPFCALR